MKCLIGSVFFFLAISQVFAFGQYVYEFGQDFGDVIYQYEGEIPLFKKVTKHNIPVPNGMVITYVKVIVDSVSSPKVDFSTPTNQVTIAFSWTQISFSKFSILVKGIEG